MSKVKKKEIEKGFYKHFKGNLYEVFDAVIHSETLENYVLYRPVNSNILWVRPYDMFFEDVEHQGQIVKRFEKVTKIQSDVWENENQGGEGDEE